jgi:catechol 2,3-dioxygenase-like lactoylglutathione lyase family enzyme
MLHVHHVGVVFEDIEAAIAFFLDLGFELEGRALLEHNEVVDAINGLDGVRAEIAMVRTPDGSGRLELITYHAPTSDERSRPLPANQPGFRHIAIEVDNVNALVARLRAQGYETVGELRDYEDFYRLCYLRGPEGIILELAQPLGGNSAS